MAKAATIWPEPDTLPAKWMGDSPLGHPVFTVTNEAGQYWAIHTDDDGNEWPYWDDDFFKSRLYESAGAIIEHMDTLGYSGPCTILQWDFTLVKESEVIV